MPGGRAGHAAAARCGALLAATTLHQRSRLAGRLGARPGRPSPYGETPVEVYSLGRTSVPGLFVAGDVAAETPQVASAMATGAMVGMAILQSLLAEDHGLPVPGWHDDPEG